MARQPTPEDLLHNPERIPGYSYGTASQSPLTPVST